MTKEELATERNEVREILEAFSEELSQSNLDKLSRVFCIINGDEKRIAEHKKENAELKKDNEGYEKENARLVQQYNDLSKENAELKEKQFSLRNERDTFLAQNEQYEKDLIDFNDQLTKATKLIRSLYNYCCSYGATGKATTEAEQFLNSEVEK